MNKEIKRKIVEDWLNAFPQLSQYSADKLYKIVGPIVIGLELIKLPMDDAYRPHFVLYPLWKSNIKECLKFPIVLEEYYDTRQFQYSIPYEKHADYFEEVVNTIIKQTPISFFNDLRNEEIVNVIDESMKKNPPSMPPYTYLDALLLESKMELTLYKSVEGAETIFQSMKAMSWDEDHFKQCGVDFTKWFDTLEQKISVQGQAEMVMKVEKNQLDKKTAKLFRSNLR